MPDEVEATGYSPTVRKRRLSAILVDLRKQAQMDVAQVCRELEISRWSLHRIENALWVKPKPRDVKDLCELYGAPAAQTTALMQLAREGRQRGWERRYNDVLTSDFVGFEDEAAAITVYEPSLITGLLQTRAYSEHVTRAAGITDESEIHRRLAVREQRQQILERETPPQLNAVFDEPTVLRAVGTPAEHREQLDHLRVMAQRPNICLRLLRLTDGPHPAAGTAAFTILDYAAEADRSLVYAETEIDSRYLEEPDELARYRLLWNRVHETALTEQGTLDHLAKIIQSLE